MNKKRIIFIILLLLGIGFLIFVYNDDFLYSKEILRIKHIDNVNSYYEDNSLGLEEEYKNNKITGIITNGKDKGKIKTFNYTETYSSVVTDKYHVGDKVFIHKNEIDGLKRDFYISLLIVIFIIFMYAVGEFKGLLSVISVLFNIIIFCIGLSLYFKGINMLLLCIIESIIFSVISLLLAAGINKKTISAIISVIVSIFIMLGGLFIIIKLTNYEGVNFNELNFLTVPVEDIILPELLLGSLGAIMDVAITMSSSISELISKDKKISFKNLKKSSHQIGKDIMSTMSNVLFFTYLCSGLPIFVLAIRNGFSMYNYITTNFSLELTRFLVGSIGIIMTIPISTYICIKIFRRDSYE